MGPEFYRRRTVASCTFVRQIAICPTKVLALRGDVPLPSRSTKTEIMDQMKEDEKRSYKYSFRLNEEQNWRFCKMLSEAGCDENRSRFIVRRIFAEEFKVVRIDPGKQRYIAMLNKFYWQFVRIGNNYNQLVRAINIHFSNTAIPKQVYLLEQQTRELKALSEQIINLSKQIYKEWLHE